LLLQYSMTGIISKSPSSCNI